ncbi:hypothetical protein LPJ70_006950 [Coemansia sp. RSA 2708]|nr:hypothetical protein LPJ70_006950 [Coemansia sp. RSA 2708]
MRNPASNFNREIFPDNSGFRSVHAHTLPGRTRDINEWAGWTWPRFHTTPLLEHPGTMHPVHYHATRPSIFSQMFEPLDPDPAQITKQADKWVIKLQNPAFRLGGAKVQVRAGRLVVSAKSRVEAPNAVEGNSFEYSTVLPRGFKAAKISAKRKDDVMEITVPIA